MTAEYRGWGWLSGQNETPSGQIETHLGESDFLHYFVIAWRAA